jgi:hypothetical protein
VLDDKAAGLRAFTGHRQGTVYCNIVETGNWGAAGGRGWERLAQLMEPAMFMSGVWHSGSSGYYGDTR